MTLVDTNVWIDHIDSPDLRMDRLLQDRQVVTHRLVIAELALGSLPQRARQLRDLAVLPLLSEVSTEEVLTSINEWKLYACGIGAVDAHLLCALTRARSVTLWTRDRRLRRAAEALGLPCVDERSGE